MNESFSRLWNSVAQRGFCACGTVGGVSAVVGVRGRVESLSNRSELIVQLDLIQKVGILLHSFELSKILQ